MLDLREGDRVILKSFTGMKLGIFTVNKASQKAVLVRKRSGEKMIFSQKTGKQLNFENDHGNYPCSIMPDDGSYREPKRGRKPKKKGDTKKCTSATRESLST